MDNNKTLLSNNKCFKRLLELMDIQEKISANVTIQKAKVEQSNGKTCTSVNPII